ncbi:rhomboid family intramembrane serine protease [Effusibacillus dendaii]|uniref:Peptidase S54 rhomboid domain-containing protein n=1 Tax=Effusibacillus dendaii TaxID=2743772 RepID=A0A7I8D8E1_9BACL|nr:rhomboid family intramembrane serine protease [Effusibacillus dendaii]BCJ86384.1 hypothetical protein skT53_13690 [Effusibacillus dendaii]
MDGMDSFQLAFARHMVQKQSYSWFPPGVVYPELTLFKAYAGRGTLIRIIPYETATSFENLLQTSFAEAAEILQDHPYRGLTVLQIILFQTAPGLELQKQLEKLEKLQISPDVSVFSAWIELETGSFTSNLPWFSKGILPKSAVREAFSESQSHPEILQEDIQQTLQKRESEWRNVYVQHSSKAVYSLLGIIIGVFLWMAATESQIGIDVLVRFGAKVNRLILAGDYWRLFVPMFLHASFLHLIVNCFALYSLRDVEWIYGSNRFLLIFLVSGIVGNVASFAFSPYPTVGASGAIFGILGSLLYFGTQRRDFFRRTMSSAVWSTLLVNLLLGFAIPQISNSGHIGGLIGGFLMSAAVGLPTERFRFSRAAAGFLLVAGLLATLWIGFKVRLV